MAGTSTAHRLVAARVAGIASCAGLLLGGCSSGPARDPATTTHRPTSAPASVLAVHQPVSVHLTLDTAVAAADGTPITGFVDVTNTTGKPIIITDACAGWIPIGLSGHEVLYGGGLSERTCPPLQLPVGTSRTPARVLTMYSICTEPGGAAAVPTPRCIGPRHDQEPPLPPGQYTTKTWIGGLVPSLARPEEVRVTLVPVSKHS